MRVRKVLEGVEGVGRGGLTMEMGRGTDPTN